MSAAGIGEEPPFATLHNDAAVREETVYEVSVSSLTATLACAFAAGESAAGFWFAAAQAGTQGSGDELLAGVGGHEAGRGGEPRGPVERVVPVAGGSCFEPGGEPGDELGVARAEWPGQTRVRRAEQMADGGPVEDAATWLGGEQLVAAAVLCRPGRRRDDESAGGPEIQGAGGEGAAALGGAGEVEVGASAGVRTAAIAAGMRPAVRARRRAANPSRPVLRSMSRTSGPGTPVTMPMLASGVRVHHWSMQA